MFQKWSKTEYTMFGWSWDLFEFWKLDLTTRDVPAPPLNCSTWISIDVFILDMDSLWFSHHSKPPNPWIAMDEAQSPEKICCVLFKSRLPGTWLAGLALTSAIMPNMNIHWFRTQHGFSFPPSVSHQAQFYLTHGNVFNYGHNFSLTLCSPDVFVFVSLSVTVCFLFVFCVWSNYKIDAIALSAVQWVRRLMHTTLFWKPVIKTFYLSRSTNINNFIFACFLLLLFVFLPDCLSVCLFGASCLFVFVWWERNQKFFPFKAQGL